MKFYKVKTEDDIKVLVDLANEIWREFWKTINSQEQIDYMLENFHSFPVIKEQILNEGYIYILLKSNDKNIGYFGVVAKDEPLDHLFLSKLYIKYEYRGKGYGRIAFDEIKRIAQKSNLKRIRLTANKYNSNTLKVYKKWGFKIIDSCIFDIGGGFVMDDYVMEYTL